MELIVLLKNEDMFYSLMDIDTMGYEDITHLDYQQMTVDSLSHPDVVEEMLSNYIHDTKYQDLFINLVSSC